MATSTDAKSFFAPKSSPLQFFAEEEIVVRPSTELIPDEYLHEDNEIALQIFHQEDGLLQELARNMAKTLCEIGLNAGPESVGSFLKVDKFVRDLHSVKNKLAGKKALVLIFLGYSTDHSRGSLALIGAEGEETSYRCKDIWSDFLTDNCALLKNRPKVMFFFTCPRPKIVVYDSVPVKSVDLERVYDFPGDSDLLVILIHHNDMSSLQTFLDEFLHNIRTSSKQFDAIDLVTNVTSHSPNSFPLIVSTLTRKFYLTASNHRAHHLSLIQNQIALEVSLDGLICDLERIGVDQKSTQAVENQVKTDGKTGKSKNLSGSFRKDRKKTVSLSSDRPPWRF